MNGDSATGSAATGTQFQSATSARTNILPCLNMMRAGCLAPRNEARRWKEMR